GATALGPPTTTVTAESEWNPSQIAPKSSFRRSPSFATRFGDGIPWTISELSEVQIEAGNGGCPYPRNDGIAPWSRMDDSATSFSSAVVTPTRTFESTRSIVAARMRPDLRILSISSGDL